MHNPESVCPPSADQPSSDVPKSSEGEPRVTSFPASQQDTNPGLIEGSGRYVLVVEDEPLARLSIRAALLKDGFKVVEAESGEAALGLFDQITPHVVILDIGLPGLNGFEVCQKIREKRADTAILMLTARGEAEDKINGLALGADDYLVKPFNPGELVARIRAVRS